MAKTLLLGDVHDRIQLASAIMQYEEPYDALWFTGDFFDQFHHDVKEAVATAKWLRDVLKDPRHHSVLGNHDVHYLYPVAQSARCSGFTNNKLSAITRTLRPYSVFRKQFPIHVWVEGFLLSHAGFHPDFGHPIVGLSEEWLSLMDFTTRTELSAGIVGPFADAGPARWKGARQNVGGPLWLDWDYEFVPIPGLNQIVGHTESRTIRTKHTEDSRNYNIDAHLREYLVIEDGKVSVKSTPKELLAQ